mmetsp:Transcript_61086/g.71016  ORF Transcript_61086/g.71016 Transcript_61086/m.71016 type:complete len:424 (+) Transcript_61086:415-1686(+)
MSSSASRQHHEHHQHHLDALVSSVPFVAADGQEQSDAGNSPCFSNWTPSSLGPASPTWMDSGVASQRTSSLPPTMDSKHHVVVDMEDEEANSVTQREDCSAFTGLDSSSSPSGDAAHRMALSRPLPLLASHRSSPQHPTHVSPVMYPVHQLDMPRYMHHSIDASTIPTEDDEDEVVGVTAEGELLFRRRDGPQNHHWQHGDAARVARPPPLSAMTNLTWYDDEVRGDGSAQDNVPTVVMNRDATAPDHNPLSSHSHPSQISGSFDSPTQQQQQASPSSWMTPSHPVVAPFRPTPRTAFGGNHAQRNRRNTVLPLQYTAATPTTEDTDHLTAAGTFASGFRPVAAAARHNIPVVTATTTTDVVELTPQALWMHDMSLRMRDRENDVYYEMVQDDLHRAVSQREAVEQHAWLNRMHSHVWDLRRL